MRLLILFFLTNLTFVCHSQVRKFEWTASIVTMNNGLRDDSMIALNNDYDLVKEEIKSQNLKINQLEDFIELIDFANRID